MTKPTSFKRTILATSIASALVGFSVTAFADDVEEVVVLGVKGAQESAVNTKREAASVVDSISAEDIGKLPDATISDSLQRIPGIQIRRNAGEGGSINIRGLPQVTTQLNGESYLGANSITTVQPNFGDVPSQLFKGADVLKSATASNLTAGLTGTVNLKTRRPFDFGDGFTSSVSGELATGQDSKKTDPSINGLVNWKNDTVGVLVAGTYSHDNLANYYEGPAGGIGGGWMSAQQVGNDNNGHGPFVGNGDGNTNEKYLGLEGFDAFNKFTERKRQGLNFSGQVDLGGGFQLIADYFYTKQDEYNRQVGIVAENKWASQNYFTAPQARVTGVNNFVVTKEYNISVGRIQSYAEVNEYFSQSQDVNLELKFDNGGPFTADTRFIHGNASQHNLNSYFQSDLMSGDSSNTNVWTDPVKGNFTPSGWVKPNPNGFTGLANININYAGSDPVWGGWNNPVSGPKGASVPLSTYIADPSSYNTAAVSSENNYDRTGTLTVLRTEGSYKFDNSFITSVDAGIRLSERVADNTVWQGVSSFDAGGLNPDGTVNSTGCQARWKATDVHFNGGSNNCQVGGMVGSTWVPYTAIGYVPLTNYKTIKVTDFGSVKGIPAVYAADPSIMDNVAAFHTKFYGNYEKSVDPGQSYHVDFNEQSEFLQANFKEGIVSGNVGVRVVETTLTVNQHITGAGQAYGLANVNLGDKVNVNEYRDVLPSANFAFDVTDDVKLRLAAAKNETPLDLDKYGQAVQVGYTIEPDGVTHGVTSVNFGGNPNLKPWRSTNYEASAEWYTAPGSLLSVGIFEVQIASFPMSVTTVEPWADLDGVVRRTTNVTRTEEGTGGSLHGLELGAKQAFDFLPGIWSHFGVDANYTYSPSVDKNTTDIQGNHPGFIDNSKNQYNLVVWYQNDGLQARVAYNYRSDRVTGNNVSYGNNQNLIGYQAAASYLDASVSYDVTEAVTVSLNASNILGEKEKYYLQFKDQFVGENGYEPRATLGVRAKF